MPPILKVLGELALCIAFWMWAALIIRRAKSYQPAELRQGIDDRLTVRLGRSHPVIRILRVDDYVSLWNIWWATWLVGFATVTALSAVEGSLHSTEVGDLMFFDAIADPINYCILTPTFVATSASFVRSIPLWLLRFYNNLLRSSSPHVEREFTNWINGLAQSREWGRLCNPLLNLVMFVVCVSFPGWAYLETGKRLAGSGLTIYGLGQNGLPGPPTVLGFYIIFILGLITYLVVVNVLVAIMTMHRFKRAYEAFQDQIQLDPLDPDGSAGMLFAGKMVLRLAAVFLLAALMTGLLILRDIQAGIVLLPYHIVAPSLFLIVIILSCTALWEPHHVLVTGRDRWVNERRTEIEQKGLTEDQRREEMQKLRDMAREYPLWPLNVRETASFLAAMTGAAAGAVLSIVQLFGPK